MVIYGENGKLTGYWGCPLNFIFNTVILLFLMGVLCVFERVWWEWGGGREKPFYQKPMPLNCFMDKLSANFLIEIKDTFELAAQEQGRKHLQSRLFLILYSCNSDALWNLLLGWNCVYHVSAQFEFGNRSSKGATQTRGSGFLRV